MDPAWMKGMEVQRSNLVKHDCGQGTAKIRKSGVFDSTWGSRIDGF
jgi:hypothetical protein